MLDDKKNRIKSPYDSDLNHAWYIVGDIYFENGNYESAIHAFKQALTAWPMDKDAMLALANSYSEIVMPDKAEKVLRDALKLDPKNPLLLYNLANSLFDQGNYQDSIILYEKIEKKDDEVYELAQKNIKRAKYK